MSCLKIPKQGLGNVGPAGHMQARQALCGQPIFFRLKKNLKMPPKMLLFRKWNTKSPFSHKRKIKKVHIVLLLARIDDHFVSNVAREQ
jgi:hypothetical protein